MKDAIRYFLGRLLARLLRGRSRPYPFSSCPVMVIAPHADDETLGCGGLLAMKSGRAEDVCVVFISDSAGSPEALPPPDQAVRRRAEALAALELLGVPGQCAHFLEAPDGRLNRLEPAERVRVESRLSALLATVRPGEIFVPYEGGGSSEHDATTRLVRGVLAAGPHAPRLWEYPVWAWWNPTRLARQLSRPGQNFHLRLDAARRRKRAALACHASQCDVIPPATRPELPPVLAALCTGPFEFYFNRSP